MAPTCRGSSTNRSCLPRTIALTAVAGVFLWCHRLGGEDRTTPGAGSSQVVAAWVTPSLCGQSPSSRGRCRGSTYRPALPSAVLAGVEQLPWDESSPVDVAEKKLLGSIICLTSSVFGFPNFKSLVQLNANGTDFQAYFFGGMVSKGPGSWYVEEGNPKEGERPQDLYMLIKQPMTDRYKKAFSITSDNCIWRGKLDFGKAGLQKAKAEEAKVIGGIVVSWKDEKQEDLIREGVFSAAIVDEETALSVQRKSAAAYERALTTPKAESTGFKTPARIAGIEKRRAGKLLPQGRDQDELLLEDASGKR
eukprot:CAMPEP_0204120844 /NCGR_PEP_ID=MMETSP0361-20130328/7875_1 /ASSEMBLY_ACC=CAM_ASM_000343 /TAXON_ID=268821 /ORGANISM="Scrippsiella Hangoei, Strain SHTV-5" /LENGTH=305 /DNA_ID=CAMNT_0051072093 /DNA_START=17 /DNA_END=934 /DNA_ORIENTATION=+